MIEAKGLTKHYGPKHAVEKLSFTVRPGFVTGRMTAGMQPAPFATDPDAVAAAIVRALARGDDVVYVPPVLRWVSVVFRHLPRVVWRKLPR